MTHIIQDNPVGVDLWIPVGVQNDRLVGPEIRGEDLSIVWANIYGIRISISIVVTLAGVAFAILCFIIICTNDPD